MKHLVLGLLLAILLFGSGCGGGEKVETPVNGPDENFLCEDGNEPTKWVKGKGWICEKETPPE